jgi:predicted ATPase/DNA-binding winged helix-turn-helix (wHTH) protein
MNLETQESISFGSFRLYPAARRLEREGRPLPLGSRALDILIVLVEHAGEVVDQRELLSRVWRGLYVCPGNLRVHVTALRKVLSDSAGQGRYIANVTGQGYCFVAPIRRPHDPEAVRDVVHPAFASTTTDKWALPPPLERMLGRESAVRSVAAGLERSRFVTIVGPGGIGKTTVAVATAHLLRPELAGAVCFVDLDSVTHPDNVVARVAAALGLEMQTATAQLIEFLRNTRMLLVLDNCEHVIDAVSSLAERIFSQAPGVHILATSREALRIEGEHTYLLAPLETPGHDPDLRAEIALGFPAVQLFMERAASSGYREALSDAEAGIVADICRRMDGIALAIELAASQVGTHGIPGTWNLVRRRLAMDWQGRRTAPPRHRTLRALLDWSYQLLADAEKLALSKLSTLIGEFSVEAAANVTPLETLDALVAKSLLSVQPGQDGSVRYRLLETTRSYVSGLHGASFTVAPSARLPVVRRGAHPRNRLPAQAAAG